MSTKKLVFVLSCCCFFSIQTSEPEENWRQVRNRAGHPAYGQRSLSAVQSGGNYTYIIDPETGKSPRNQKDYERLKNLVIQQNTRGRREIEQD